MGHLEEIILLLVLSHDKVTGSQVVQRYEQFNNKTVSLPSVVVVLKRLEKKGYLKTTEGAPTAQRGGRSRKLYSATPLGYKLAEEVKKSRELIWQHIPKFDF